MSVNELRMIDGSIKLGYLALQIVICAAGLWSYVSGSAAPGPG